MHTFKNIPWLFFSAVIPLVFFFDKVTSEFISNGYEHKQLLGFFVCLLLLLVLVSVCKITTLKIDTLRNKIYWSTFGVFGKKFEDLNFSDVTDVVVNAMSDRNTQMYRVELKTQSKTYPLSVSFSSGRSKSVKLQERILELLSLPNSNSVPGSIMRLVKMGRKIEAIKLARNELNLSLAEAKAYVDDADKILP